MSHQSNASRHVQTAVYRRRLLPAIAGIVLVVALPGGAAAQSTGAPADSWQFELTPYLWMAGMKGDVQSGSLPKTSLDVGFSDIFDALDFGMMGALEARKGCWGILVDAQYIKLSASGTATRTGPGPLGASLTAGADVEMKQTIFSAAATYRLTDGPTQIDAIGGLRYMQLDVDADIGASLFGPLGGSSSRSVSRSGSESWTDPYIGVRIQHPVSDRLTLMGYVDVGGFNVGSKSTVQALGGISYDFTKTISGKLGYRYLKVDYDNDGFLFDMTMEGAYLGLGLRF